MQSIGEVVRKQETDYRRGSVKKSKYVTFSMHDTIEKIDAYLNSTHVTGSTDSLGRKKPFFNICTAVVNIWFRATDIDTKNIKFRSDNSKQWLNVTLAKIFVRDWMRRERFAVTLNEWGRTLARYGGAVLKSFENDGGLHIYTVPWQKHICDAVEYGPNPKTEILELTPAELKRRVQTHGYDANAVKELIDALENRETIDKQKKDYLAGFIKLYETHGMWSRAQLLKGQKKPSVAGDENIFLQQVHVISFVGKKKGRDVEYTDFTLYAGEEDYDPYMLTSLIPEPDRTLPVGPVENLFQAQWMINHAKKAELDIIDIASKLVFQTADPNLIGTNVWDSLETGDVLVHAMNRGITKIDTSKADMGGTNNFALSWKQLGQELSGVSEAMLGIMPPSGTPASQTIAMLRENYSLFETMTENKGLHIIDLMRQRVLPYIRRTKLKSNKEIGAALDAADIARIDSVFLKDAAIKKTNKEVMDAIEANLDRIEQGKGVQPIDVGAMMQGNMQNMQESLNLMGNQRFFKPSEITEKMWDAQFEGFEWDMEIDVTGEERDAREALAGLEKALTLVMNPNFEGNPRAKAIVGKYLDLVNVMSPLEYHAIPSGPQNMTPPPAARPPMPLPAPAAM